MKRCEEDRLKFIKQNSFYINYKNSKLYGCRNASKKTNFTHTQKKKEKALHSGKCKIMQ